MGAVSSQAIATIMSKNNCIFGMALICFVLHLRCVLKIVTVCRLEIRCSVYSAYVTLNVCTYRHLCTSLMLIMNMWFLFEVQFELTFD